MDDNSLEYANLSNLNFIETLYREFLKNPEQVESSWRYFFQGMQMAASLQGLHPSPSREVASHKKWDLRAKNLITAYRQFGHLAAHLNPFKDKKDLKDIEELIIETYGFSREDLEAEVSSYGVLPQSEVKLSLLLKTLQSIYCNTIGIELSQLDAKKQEFIIKKIEPSFKNPLNHEEKKAILQDLNRSESFESFIHMKYPGQKRFSLEGGESFIPLLNEVLDQSAHLGVKECVIGMAHRGRLNVLANIMQKSYTQIFYEFSPFYMPNTTEGSGDVKYHKGFKSVIKTRRGLDIQVDLCENPSHLEAINPVLEGIVKAKQIKGDPSILPILVHGDGSVAGQGVVYETLQLSRLEGYDTGGTLHFVINNQVGYTATEKEGRSTRYCTDIAKTFECPIFHVNGDDPEACVYIARLAAELRHYFKCDVFIEVICYRKYGHSEGDEPFFTQPKLYQEINKKKNVRDLYRDHLLELGELKQEEAAELEKSFREQLHKAEAEVTQLTKRTSNETPSLKTPFPVSSVVTKVEQKILIELAEVFCSLPSDLVVHPKVQRLFSERLSSIHSKEGIDWGLAEYLAYSTLLIKGHPVRISGEDSQRGTFAHRHATIVDQNTEKKYFPLQHLSKSQAAFTVYNSCLSEYAVLGFEFGYAQIMKEGLTIWEAQFGDFANGAQIIIDQFISSAEQKWGVKNSLVLFLPHGNEGQGPEHTSARLERFLQLAAESNIQIIVPSKPSQVFHILCKQVLGQIQKPLILFTPKAILRYPPSMSTLEEFSEGSFQEIIEDKKHLKASKLIFCSGKIYYDLIEEREKKKAHHIAIIRIEQLYPLNVQKIEEIFREYSQVKQCCWVQEEHKNMGGYEYISHHLREILPDNLKLCYVGRARSASPAAGSLALHQKEKEQLLKNAFGEEKQ